LKDHRKDYTLISGLAHDGQGGRQPHSCEMTWLTAARNPGLDGFRNSVSVDQYAADKLGYVARFPSVVLGSKSEMSQSYSNSGVMVPAENSPARMFAKLFLEGEPWEVERQRRNLSDGRSILDSLMDQAKIVQRRASSGDKAQLEEYFESVRKAERDLVEAQAWMDRPKPVVDVGPPEDISEVTELMGRTQLLIDLIPLIVQTDSSRVVTVMNQDHAAVPNVEGVSDEHHNLSHHGKDPDNIAQLRRIESDILRRVDSLLTQLKQKEEAGGNLLDNTMVLFGSNLGNANAHDSKNLPILLAGGGLNHGGYIAHDKDNNTPLCNLFLTMLNNMGMETESFSQSTGALTW